MPGDLDLQSLFKAQHVPGDLLGAKKLEEGTGLCLSGGGYRAMLYHGGVIRCLNELGILPRLTEIASVSGGSITAGILGAGWRFLRFNDLGQAENLEDVLVNPIKRMAARSIDIRAAILGMLPGLSAAKFISASYDAELFKGAGLQDLPDAPRFTFMATNLQTGSGWRFGKAYAADFRVGQILSPRFSLASVVAASSAFPPFLSPARFSFEGQAVKEMAGADLHREPFISQAILTDGGVYDNLGLERVWKRCRTILVSNAGRNIPDIGNPSGFWWGQAYRTINIIQGQAENSRKRMLFSMANEGQRKVAYWSIDTPPTSYAGCSDAIATDDESVRAAALRTRLNVFSTEEIDLLMRVGYAGCSAAIRAHLPQMCLSE